MTTALFPTADDLLLETGLFTHLVVPKAENCLGALDGTHVTVRASIQEKPRYQNKKGEVSINVLGVCTLAVNSYTVQLGGKIQHTTHEFYEMLCQDLMG
ncbi:hypothetical protein LINPERHAP2_LOCUS42009 [Linum perenne]